MAIFDNSALFGKLNDLATTALVAAFGQARVAGHGYVQLEHWLLAVIKIEESDAARIIRHFEIDEGELGKDLQGFLDRLPAADAHEPSIHPQIRDAVRDAWLTASLGQTVGQRIRTGHLLLACFSDESTAEKLGRVSRVWRKLDANRLRDQFDQVTRGSGEAAGAAVPGQAKAPMAPGSGAPMAASGPSALDRFTLDLTARARAGQIDPVFGRDDEIRQVIDILVRRRQNNPILTGEAGVGKTAIAEGFALRVAAGDVPDALAAVELRELDLGLLQAGAGVKGEFEQRLMHIIEAVRRSPVPVILFVDEAHSLIGAGGQAGQNDAANLLKPALARGDLRMIAATTWAEYKKYFEKDAALTRRFQTVKIEEPADEIAVGMLRGLVPALQAHHGVTILEEALTETVRLSRRYIPARQLPDKAVGVLDTACARVSMSRSTVPAPIEAERRCIATADRLIERLTGEMALGRLHDAALAAERARRDAAAQRLQALEARWQVEKEQVRALRALGNPAPDGAAPEPTPLTPGALTYADRERALATLQGDDPLVLAAVDRFAVAKVVADWTGIPVGRMGGDAIRTILGLEDRLKSRIVGQDHALAAICEAVVTSRAKLTDPRKPTGVFLMVGTSGVGKTETAIALAELLFGGEQSLTVINMSEFKEEHKISMLLGAPPGYVGYGEGGVLTEAVRRRPYGIVLLDEIEKAHPGLQDLFYQVFDKGSLRDGEGRDIDFKNTILIMTSNAGTELIARRCANPGQRPDAAELLEALRPELLKTFKPAFLGRTTIVPYFPLSDQVIRDIVTLQVERIGRRVAEQHGAAFSCEPGFIDQVARRCREGESGARAIERILAHGLLPRLSAALLQRMIAGDSIAVIRVKAADAADFSFEIV